MSIPVKGQVELTRAGAVHLDLHLANPAGAAAPTSHFAAVHFPALADDSMVCPTPEEILAQVANGALGLHPSREPLTINQIKQQMRNIRQKLFGNPNTPQWSHTAGNTVAEWLRSSKRRRTGPLPPLPHGPLGQALAQQNAPANGEHRDPLPEAEPAQAAADPEEYEQLFYATDTALQQLQAEYDALQSTLEATQAMLASVTEENEELREIVTDLRARQNTSHADDDSDSTSSSSA